MLDSAPRFSTDDAGRLSRENFGVSGDVFALTSERDQNFLVRGDNTAIVLKIANATEDRAMLDAQRAVLTHLESGDLPVPRLRGDSVSSGSHSVWAISVLEGNPLGDVRRRSPALWRDFGRTVARLNRALASFDHPAIHRDFYWDIANARSIVEQYRGLIADQELAAAIDKVCGNFDRHTAPLIDQLPRSAVHGDLNDYNVLVGGGEDLESRDQRVTGIVDFGDMVHSYRVADLAIAIAYAMLGSDDPLVIFADIVRGFATELGLQDAEWAALFGLSCMRLCASACIAAEQQRQAPENAYLGVSQAAIRRLLPVLAKIPFRLPEIVAREAAGLEPLTSAPRVIEYLKRATFSDVMVGMRDSIVLDLSVTSPELSGDPRLNAEPILTRNVFAAIENAGVTSAIGRYDEPRLLYTTPEFALGPNPTDEHRTIHLGLDIFMAPGTPVYAPLDGTVYAFHDNATLLDYGPVIVLRHETDEGVPFFTLYGHLSRESLVGLSVGKMIKAGDQVATLGTPEVNVGWSPHLHLQIILDLLELDTDFPGVGRPTQRRVWTALSPDPNLITRIQDSQLDTTLPSKAETLARRRAHIGGNLSIAYRDPVRVVRGWMQYLYDDEGRCYLDAYNNVPHVGHAHARVNDAASTQARILNTNTRYLNDLLATYAEKLSATFPAGLDVCYFVSSASEANELAIRLARAYTGARDTIVLEAAYHGNTTTLIDISPYKHAGPGGQGAPDWVHVAPLPDVYRGPFKAGDPKAGEKYAAAVGEIVDNLAERGKRPAMFIAETCPSVGGQLIFPPNYLANVYAHVRRAGGVCVADEVQTGLGRMGTSFWAFEDQGVVPDIVVMGKPLGNGHPIGAVVTTRAIADAFDNGMEYFSTFGGNTVSCAIGARVLDIVHEQKLQEHALRVGKRILERLRPLVNKFEIVGDVRGSGLFLGVELVRDRQSLEPAGAEASFVANRMRERGVLLGTDGPYHNVVKIRPPMPFNEGDADLLVDELERALTLLS